MWHGGVESRFYFIVLTANRNKHLLKKSAEQPWTAFKWRLPEWGFQMKIGLKFRKHRGIHFRKSECIVEISAEVRVTHSSSPKPPCITCTRHEELSRINSSLTLAKTLTWYLYLQALAVVGKTCASGEGALWLCSTRDLPVLTHACMSAHGKCLKQVILAQVRVYTQRLTWDSNHWDIRELYNISSKPCVSPPLLLLSPPLMCHGDEETSSCLGECVCQTWFRGRIYRHMRGGWTSRVPRFELSNFSRSFE